MNVQLDWKAGDENGAWETVAIIGNRARGVTHWRRWVALALAAPLLFAAGGMLAILLLRRYDAALEHVTRQVQDAIDLEARTMASQAEPESPAQTDARRRPSFARSR